MINEVLPAFDSGDIATDVRQGLTAPRKSLPCYLLYDEAGSRLYEEITKLPEYYLFRAERAILEEHADDIAARARAGATAPVGVIELGAGSALKTEALLRAVLKSQTRCRYIPIDVSPSALDQAQRRLRASLPQLQIQPLVMPHMSALRSLSGIDGRQLALFIGSSIGNLDDKTALTLLRSIRRALGADTRLLLGTDLQKSANLLLPAYDDAAGATAAFNKNVLARINRELGGRFELDRFHHVARWNERESRIEMHLRSISEQTVHIARLRLGVHFDAGETIHTESCKKYDLPGVKSLLQRSGFALVTSYFDRERLFAVHLAEAL